MGLACGVAQMLLLVIKINPVDGLRHLTVNCTRHHAHIARPPNAQCILQRFMFLDSLSTLERREYSFALESASPAAAEAAAASRAGLGTEHRRLKVVWLSRTWFGRTMAAGGGLNGWQQQRQMGHDKERAIVTALEAAVIDWNHRACAPPVFGWWQKAKQVAQQEGCKPTNVSFDFYVSASRSSVCVCFCVCVCVCVCVRVIAHLCWYCILF